MIIAVFPHEKKKDSISLTKKIITYLNKHKIEVVSEDHKAKLLKIKSINAVNPKKIKFLIAMGGDGTMLRLAHRYTHLEKPILGINLGYLGFMADIPQNDVFSSLDDLISKKYKIENRIMLEGKTPGNESFIAINDIVFHRGYNHSLIETSLYIDNTFVNNFSADGLIISTPTGSTAYSLSAGGPILSPQLDAFVITPICPHTISNRPFVITANHKIEIKYLSNHKHTLQVHADGMIHFEMKTNETFKIKKSQKKFKLVKLKRHDYFSTLRTKLNWTGKIKF